MKEIKAYVRPGPLGTIIDRLAAEGARDLVVTRVDVLGALARTDDDCLQRYHKYPEHHSDVARLELTCADTDVERFVNVLREASPNGGRGDGRIVVSHVEAAINLGGSRR